MLWVGCYFRFRPSSPLKTLSGLPTWFFIDISTSMGWGSASVGCLPFLGGGCWLFGLPLFYVTGNIIVSIPCFCVAPSEATINIKLPMLLITKLRHKFIKTRITRPLSPYILCKGYLMFKHRPLYWYCSVQC